jgi:hypothetical protein
MSKISEDLQQAMQEASQGNPLEQVKRLIDNNAVLGRDEFKERSKKEITTILRGAKFRFAGGTPWGDGSKAILDTGTYMSRRIEDFVIRCTAEGMMIGFNRDDLKEVCAHKWDQVYQDYQDRIDIYAMNIRLDNDAMTLLVENIGNALNTFDNLIGFSEMTGKETLHVWDLWRQVLGACSLAMFVCGQRVGEKWREEEVLEGILSATERNASEVRGDQ